MQGHGATHFAEPALQRAQSQAQLQFRLQVCDACKFAMQQASCSQDVGCAGAGARLLLGGAGGDEEQVVQRDVGVDLGQREGMHTDLLSRCDDVNGRQCYRMG